MTHLLLFCSRGLLAIPIFLLLLTASSAEAQAPLKIFTDRRVNGFEDWSWGTRSFTNAAPVHGGTNSIRVSVNANEALSFHHADLDARLYQELSFWVHGGTNGGQRLQVLTTFGTQSGTTYSLPSALTANAWQQFIVPLSSLGVANATNLNRISLQLKASGTTGTFYVDDLQLNARPAPALVQVSVNATQTLRSVDARWFGVNTAIWDKDFSDNIPQTVALLREMGMTTLRFPGGSLSDEYHWASNKSLTNTWEWWLSFSEFKQAATNLGAQVFITVNYGTGTPAEAATWVRHANVTNKLGFAYWEIGNENYGTWEADTNARPHDAYTYAVRTKDYLQQMKAADPSIKVGIVLAGGEDSYDNGYTNHPALNPRTGKTHHGWTPVLLTTLKNLGVTPDFAVYHYYPEYTDQESDPLLLQASVNWARDAADLRQQLTDYFGPTGTNIELVVTENNSNAGTQGRQSTSLVNGLYYADSLGQVMKTEFNSFIWWDLRNGTDTSGNMDASIYGWRTYGDLGMVNGATNRHPTFYAAKLLKDFAQPADTVVSAASDYALLSAYAVRRAGGALSLLVINKDGATNFTAAIALNGFVPDTTATVRSYGIPQDEAARTNAVYALRDISLGIVSGVAGNFNCSFPPYSMTVLTLAPAAPRLGNVPVTAPDRVVIQIQGQPGVRYVLQNSTNLGAWTPVSTNTLVGSTLNVTNAITAGAGAHFWRAVWQP